MPEVEFREVALQVLLADMVVRPHDAPLEDAKVIFDRVGMMEAASTDIFARTVIDSSMPGLK